MTAMKTVLKVDVMSTVECTLRRKTAAMTSFLRVLERVDV